MQRFGLGVGGVDRSIGPSGCRGEGIARVRGDEVSLSLKRPVAWTPIRKICAVRPSGIAAKWDCGCGQVGMRGTHEETDEVGRSVQPELSPADDPNHKDHRRARQRGRERSASGLSGSSAKWERNKCEQR
jgi:hypothetical protein